MPGVHKRRGADPTRATKNRQTSPHKEDVVVPATSVRAQARVGQHTPGVRCLDTHKSKQQTCKINIKNRDLNKESVNR